MINTEIAKLKKSAQKKERSFNKFLVLFMKENQGLRDKLARLADLCTCGAFKKLK